MTPPSPGLTPHDSSRKDRKRSAKPERQAAASAGPAPALHGREIAICALLVAINLAIYAQVSGHPFISLDDDEYILRNPTVLAGMTSRGVAWAFTSFYAANWHPLTWLSHMLDVQLFGLNAGAHHLVNLLLHVANVLLLFLVLRRATGAVWRSALVAALFSVHPLHVESVAWVAERKDLLSTLFWLLATWAYVRYAQDTSSWRWYGTAILMLALGLMAKPMLVTLPFTLLLLDIWPLRRFLGAGGAAAGGAAASAMGGVAAGGPTESAASRAGSLRGRHSPPLPGSTGMSSMGKASKSSERRIDSPAAGGAATDGGSPATLLLREKIAFFALALASGVVTFIAQRSSGAVQSIENVPLAYRVSNACVACVRYLIGLVWPGRLAVYYPYPPQGVSLVAGVGSVVLLTLITLLVLRERGRRSYLLTGWLWYLGTLVPVIGLVQVGSQSMADRYTYVPFIGLFVMISWGAGDLAAVWPRLRPWLTAAATALLVVLAVASWNQVAYWADSVTLFERTLAVTKDNAAIHYNLGDVLSERGQTEEAISHFQEALRIWPGFYSALFNMGVALAARGRLEEAVDYYQRALRVDPRSVEAHVNLGSTLAQRGELEAARPHLEEALRLDPNSADAHVNLGLLLLHGGKVAQATTHLSEAVLLRPQSAEAHNNLGLALYVVGDNAGAIREFSRALELKPDYEAARDNLERARSSPRGVGGTAP